MEAGMNEMINEKTIAVLLIVDDIEQNAPDARDLAQERKWCLPVILL